MTHPETVLWDEQQYRRPMIPCCDHYAGNTRFMKKALAYQHQRGPLFDITLDCEDGAVVNQEKHQIETITKIMNDRDLNRFNRLGIRLHPAKTDFFEEEVVSFIQRCGHKVAYFSLPKIESAQDFFAVSAFIRSINHKYGVQHIPLHPIVETPLAVETVHTLAADDSVECISFGIMDFVSSYGGLIADAAMKSPEQFKNPFVVDAKRRIASACVTHHRVASHNVTILVGDENQMTIQNDAEQARYWGFTRMWSIHPAQIEPIIAAMTPPIHLISYAADILLKAQKNNWGPIKDSNNELKDRASYRYYWHVLKTARAMGAPLPDQAKKFFDHEEERVV